jgi:hypothetical protein
MKVGKWLLVLALASGSALAAQGDAWCTGYMEGYRDGYTQTRGEPPHMMSPVCPVAPKRPEGERRSEEQRGYDTGFKNGARDGSR